MDQQILNMKNAIDDQKTQIAEMHKILLDLSKASLPEKKKKNRRKMLCPKNLESDPRKGNPSKTSRKRLRPQE